MGDYDPGQKLKRVHVLVETPERSFRGYMHAPLENQRLSDYLNSYPKNFLCLDDVKVSDRGKHYATGESVPFVAISLGSIIYLCPLDDGV